MPFTTNDLTGLKFHPVTAKRWKDFEILFGKRGACGGCWCMWWRLSRVQFNKQKGEGNRRSMKRIIESGEIPGILAYSYSQPIGWCAIAPREKFVLLDNSRILKRVDDKPVWSVVCFFVAKPFRRNGISLKLLEAATEFARKKKAKIVEGYPVEPRKGNTPDLFAYHGLASVYRKAGFKEVLRRSGTRPIMRYFIRR